MSAKPEVGSIASWYGSNRMCAPRVGEELEGCSWVGVVFAGAMSEVPHITARTLMLNDKHFHVMNLARVMADPKLGPQLYRRLRRIPFGRESLELAQFHCSQIEAEFEDVEGLFPITAHEQREPDRHEDPVEWAQAYFVASWMARHSLAGTKNEFDAPVSIRWTASGGGSSTHYWGAVRSMVAWRRILQRADFMTLDFREFLGKCKDEDGVGIYCDSPFPDAGDGYKFKFTPKDFSDLAKLLATFTSARVVIRYHDHPLIRELYPESRWTWRRFAGRKQTNAAADEVLIINGKSYAKGAA